MGPAYLKSKLLKLTVGSNSTEVKFVEGTYKGHLLKSNLKFLMGGSR